MDLFTSEEIQVDTPIQDSPVNMIDTPIYDDIIAPYPVQTSAPPSSDSLIDSDIERTSEQVLEPDQSNVSDNPSGSQTDQKEDSGNSTDSEQTISSDKDITIKYIYDTLSDIEENLTSLNENYYIQSKFFSEQSRNLLTVAVFQSVLLAFLIGLFIARIVWRKL